MAKTVIITSKPSMTRLVAPFLVSPNCPWAGDEITFVQTLYLGPFQFDYPRGRAWREHPLVEEPAYRLRADGLIRPLKMVGEALEAMDEAEGWDTLAKADQIIYASDPGYTEVYVAKLMLAHVGRETAFDQIPAVWFKSLTPSEIKRAVHGSRTLRLGEMERMVDYAATKRHFEFNWNLNANTILGRTMRQSGASKDARIPSKYGLQVLYYLRNMRNQVITESDIFQSMEDGSIGTGRYVEGFFGSPASRSAIIKQLEESDLIGRTKRGTEIRDTPLLTESGKVRYMEIRKALQIGAPEAYHAYEEIEEHPLYSADHLAYLMKETGELKRLEMEPLLKAGLCEMKPFEFKLPDDLKPTALGETFLSALHPDCEDRDLAGRLHLWCEEGLASARPKIDRYIRTFFGKQMRFLSQS